MGCHNYKKGSPTHTTHSSFHFFRERGIERKIKELGFQRLGDFKSQELQSQVSISFPL